MCLLPNVLIALPFSTPEIPWCSTATTSPIPFVPQALTRGTPCISRCHPHRHLCCLVLSSPSWLPASGGVGFKSRKTTKTGVLFIALSSAFRVHQTSHRETSTGSSFILFPCKRIYLSFLPVETSWFSPFSLDKGCVYSLLLLILKRSPSFPTTCRISCIKIPQICIKGVRHFIAAYLQICFLPTLGLGTCSKFLPPPSFSLIKKLFCSVRCLLVARLHGMDNQVYHCYLERINRCLYQPALLGVDLYSYRQLNLSLF